MLTDRTKTCVFYIVIRGLFYWERLLRINALAAPLSLILRYISWHLIESIFLKYKKKKLLEIKFLRNIIKTTNAKY